MKEFIDNLISRLEKEPTYNVAAGEDYIIQGNALPKSRVIEIVNQLAEEYKGGWIPCSERLPELTKGTECFKQSELCLVTEEWWDDDTSIAVGWYNQSGVWSNEATNCKVVAWMPLPEPYRKEGE